MTRLYLGRCDACQATAPLVLVGGVIQESPSGWFLVTIRPIGGDGRTVQESLPGLHFCSWGCMARYASDPPSQAAV